MHVPALIHREVLYLRASIYCFWPPLFVLYACMWVRPSLFQDYLSASSDLQEVLHLDPNVHEAEQELEEVTVLLRKSLVDGAARS